jgi:peptidoglycan/LPS O-acetylase OafA/YrhL
MDALAVGALVAIIPTADVHRFARYALPVAAAAAVPFAVMSIVMRGTHPTDLPIQTVGFTIVAVFFGAVILHVRASEESSLTYRVLSFGPLTFLGTYSYAMYVVHIQFIVIANRLLVDTDTQLGTVYGSELPLRLLYVAVLFAITSAAGLLSWNLYERHFLKLKDRFPTRAKETKALRPHRSTVND